ncbi:MAG: hypothetical protein GX256_07945 [Fretibacterium sp.]|nr:hypothetical protein [Fretibacterium sp.]
MGRTTNKIRQIFNIFLILLLITVVTGVFVWFLTEPANRDESFWVSMGAVLFSAIVATLFSFRIAWRSDKGRQIPYSFSQFLLVILYVVFTIAMAVANVYKNFSLVTLLLIHAGGVALLLLPLLLINMAALKSSGADRKEAQQGRANLAADSRRLFSLAEDLERALPSEKERLRPIRELADNLNYSDPNPAPKALEQSLQRALEALQAQGASLLKLEQEARMEGLEDLLTACTQAKRALEERNETILRNK